MATPAAERRQTTPGADDDDWGGGDRPAGAFFADRPEGCAGPALPLPLPPSRCALPSKAITRVGWLSGIPAAEGREGGSVVGAARERQNRLIASRALAISGCRGNKLYSFIRMYQ